VEQQMISDHRTVTADPTFVFVHGGWSSGFNYHQVITELIAQGRRA
jgi:hypothetical protein